MPSRISVWGVVNRWVEEASRATSLPPSNPICHPLSCPPVPPTIANHHPALASLAPPFLNLDHRAQLVLPVPLRIPSSGPFGPPRLHHAARPTANKAVANAYSDRDTVSRCSS